MSQKSGVVGVRIQAAPIQHRYQKTKRPAWKPWCHQRRLPEVENISPRKRQGLRKEAYETRLLFSLGAFKPPERLIQERSAVILLFGRRPNTVGTGTARRHTPHFATAVRLRHLLITLRSTSKSHLRDRGIVTGIFDNSSWHYSTRMRRRLRIILSRIW